jgi:GABA(A) receptor-associated protein
MLSKQSFKDRPLEQRKRDVQSIFKKYPDRIPICVTKSRGSNITELDKEKFLVPKEITVGEFLYVIRKRIKLEPNQAIFIFFNNTLVNIGMTIQEVYNEHHDKDDEMLYAIYASENTFG